MFNKAILNITSVKAIQLLVSAQTTNLKMQETLLYTHRDYTIRSYDFHIFIMKCARAHAPLIAYVLSSSSSCSCFLAQSSLTLFTFSVFFFLSHRNYLLFVSFMNCLACMTSLDYAFAVLFSMDDGRFGQAIQLYSRQNDKERQREN